MLEVLQSGGWLMVPILLCSIIAFAIIGERFWVLRYQRIFPEKTLQTFWQNLKNPNISAGCVTSLKTTSPLGAIFAEGLAAVGNKPSELKVRLEEKGREGVLELERYLSALGTIAAITPLLGLLGTVIGMIKVFSAIMAEGVGQPEILAGGISEALVTTAAGLFVAIPSLICYRIFQRRIDVYALKLEQETKRLMTQTSSVAGS